VFSEIFVEENFRNKIYENLRKESAAIVKTNNTP